MIFDEPRFLFLLLLLIPPMFFAPRRFGRRIEGLLSLVGQSIQGGRDALVRDLRYRYILSTVFFLSSMALSVLALAGPRWGERFVSEYRRGVDVVFAVDVSRSMDARDCDPSRLGRALSIAREVVKASPGIRFAAAIGKGSGNLAVPLSDDTESVLTLFGAISSASMSASGTNLEHLVDAARASFIASSPAHRLIVLLSDGESLSGTLALAADRAAAEGIEIIAAGVGSSEGAPIPADGDVVRLADGRSVISVLRSDVLKSAAERGGGFYVDGNKPDADNVIAERISSLSSTSESDGFRREAIPRGHLFLILALVAFAASKLVESSFRRKK